MSVVRTSCDLCDDTGWKPTEKDGLRAVVECDCMKAKREAARREVFSGDLSKAIPGLGRDHGAAFLKQFSEPIVAEGLAALSPQSRGLLITGKAGSGKTHFMAALSREALIRNMTVRWSMSRTLLRRIWRACFEQKDETEQQVVDDLLSVGVLAIDDLGHEGKISDAVIGALHEIISRRHDEHHPTLVTTNLTPDDIAAAYDDAIASRMRGWGLIIMAGQDRRNS